MFIRRLGIECSLEVMLHTGKIFIVENFNFFKEKEKNQEPPCADTKLIT